MSDEAEVETVIKDCTLEEIESLRDNIANEISKRTNLLKSIVKDKYKDIVDTSDAIHSIKTILTHLEKSIKELDIYIAKFYYAIKQPEQSLNPKETLHSEKDNNCGLTTKDLIYNYAKMWDSFDSGDIVRCIQIHKQSVELLSKDKDSLKPEQARVIENLKKSFARARDMIKNRLWQSIINSDLSRVGLISSNDDIEIFKLGLEVSEERLAERLRESLFDNSNKTRVGEYQPCSYFNVTSNQIDATVDELKPPRSGYVQIPRNISAGLSTFLCNICQAINTLAGTNLSDLCARDSLDATIAVVLNVYGELVNDVAQNNTENKRKRALQLYFDLLYVRKLFIRSEHFESTGNLEFKLVELAHVYESMVDSVELFIVTKALDDSLNSLVESTIGSYSLLTLR